MSREYDFGVIDWTNCKANTAGDIGFLWDNKRSNVAITRFKFHLISVFSEEILKGGIYDKFKSSRRLPNFLGYHDELRPEWVYTVQGLPLSASTYGSADDIRAEKLKAALFEFDNGNNPDAQDPGQGTENDNAWGSAGQGTENDCKPLGGSSQGHGDTKLSSPPRSTKLPPSTSAPELPPPKGLEHLATPFNLAPLTALKEVLDLGYTRQETSGVDLYCGVNALEISFRATRTEAGIDRSPTADDLLDLMKRDRFKEAMKKHGFGEIFHNRFSIDQLALLVGLYSEWSNVPFRLAMVTMPENSALPSVQFLSTPMDPDDLTKAHVLWIYHDDTGIGHFEGVAPGEGLPLIQDYVPSASGATGDIKW